MKTKRTSSSSRHSSRPTEALSDWATFVAQSPAEKQLVAAAVAAELGADFRAGSTLVGDAQLPTVVHLPTETELVLVPGGTFTMGFSDADRAAVAACFDAEKHARVLAAIDQSAPRMQPVHEVHVRPFALARTPLTDTTLIAKLLGKPQGQAFSWERAHELAASLGFRLPSEAEWEYVAREGRGLSFLLSVDDAHRGGTAERTETAWGIAQLGQAGWLADRWHADYTGAPTDGSAWATGSGNPMFRGSFELGLAGLDDDDDDELAFALTALRVAPPDVPETDVWLRLALGPDSAGKWTCEKRDVPAPPTAAEAPAKTTSAPAQTDLDVAYARIAAFDLDQAIDELSVAPARVLNQLVAHCLSLCAYPASAEVYPLVTELTAAQRRVLVATTTRSGIGFAPHVPIPTNLQIRKRWLQLAPPTLVEREVHVSSGGSGGSGASGASGGTARTWPLWRAWQQLTVEGREDERRALVPSDVDWFELVARTKIWGSALYQLSCEEDLIELGEGLGTEGAQRAALLVDETLACLSPVLVEGSAAPTYRAASDPDGRAAQEPPAYVEPEIWGALLVTVLAGGGNIMPAWEGILPFEGDFVRTWLAALEPARRDAIARASFRRARFRPSVAFAVLRAFSNDLPGLARDVAAQLASESYQTGREPRAVTDALAAWKQLRAVLPPDTWTPVLRHGGPAPKAR